MAICIELTESQIEEIKKPVRYDPRVNKTEAIKAMREVTNGSVVACKIAADAMELVMESEAKGINRQCIFMAIAAFKAVLETGLSTY